MVVLMGWVSKQRANRSQGALKDLVEVIIGGVLQFNIVLAQAAVCGLNGATAIVTSISKCRRSFSSALVSLQRRPAR
jgi:hypothetical protein